MDDLPAEWHARQLNNRFAALSALGKQHGNGGGKKKGKGKEKEGNGQWLPGIGDVFWETYVNKLRVNASEGGVCDLEGGWDN